MFYLFFIFTCNFIHISYFEFITIIDYLRQLIKEVVFYTVYNIKLFNDFDEIYTRLDLNFSSHKSTNSFKKLFFGFIMSLKATAVSLDFVFNLSFLVELHHYYLFNIFYFSFTII